MGSYQYRLQRYLEAEAELNKLFQKLNYCFPYCVQPELAAKPDIPVVACCKDRYYKKYDVEHPAFDLLRDERERLFGKPETITGNNTNSPCEYHTHTGCVLKTHKSPICLGFMCPESITFMRNEFGIFTYDYAGIHNGLEWILTGDLNGTDLDQFIDECRQMTTIITSDADNPPG